MKHKPHSHSPSQGATPPQGFIDEILLGPASSRARAPINEAFNVSIGPEFDRGKINYALSQVTGMTKGQVGFVFESNRPANVFFRVDPKDPAFKDIKSGFAAVTYRNEIAGVVKGFGVVYNQFRGLDKYGKPIYWPDAIKPAMHEAGHGVGLGHVHNEQWGALPCIMGGADCYQDTFNPWEQIAYFTPLPPASRSLLKRLSLQLPAKPCVCTFEEGL